MTRQDTEGERACTLVHTHHGAPSIRTKIMIGNALLITGLVSLGKIDRHMQPTYSSANCQAISRSTQALQMSNVFMT